MRSHHGGGVGATAVGVCSNPFITKSARSSASTAVSHKISPHTSALRSLGRPINRDHQPLLLKVLVTHDRTTFWLNLGIAQIAVRPPPCTQRGTLGHFVRALFEGLYGSNSKKSAPNHPGKGLDPPPQTGNAQMNRDIFMLGLP